MRVDRLVELGQENVQMNLNFVLVLRSQKAGYKQL